LLHGLYSEEGLEKLHIIIMRIIILKDINICHFFKTSDPSTVPLSSASKYSNIALVSAGVR